MGRKDAKNVNDMSTEELDALLQAEASKEAASPSLGPSTTVNFVTAVLVSAMPLYLYTTAMFELNIQDHGIYMAAVTVVSAVFLMMAYNKSSTKEIRRLSALADSRPRKNGSSDNGAAIVKQATAWAYFINNLLFLGMFLILAFNIMPAAVPNFINYIISVAGPAVVVHLLS